MRRWFRILFHVGRQIRARPAEVFEVGGGEGQHQVLLSGLLSAQNVSRSSIQLLLLYHWPLRIFHQCRQLVQDISCNHSLADDF